MVKLFLTFLFLGFEIGGISWAMFTMLAQSDYSVDADSSFPAGYTGESVKVGSDPSLVLTTPDKTLYPAYPAEGDNIGSLTIPALNLKLPLLQGTDAETLKKGDQLIVQTSAGTFVYEVNGMRIVHADDRTVNVPTDHGVLTMTTCYPLNTPGYYPDRYIVSAALINSK